MNKNDFIDCFLARATRSSNSQLIVRNGVTYNQDLSNAEIFLFSGQLPTVPETQRVDAKDREPQEAYESACVKALLDAEPLGALQLALISGELLFASIEGEHRPDCSDYLLGNGARHRIRLQLARRQRAEKLLRFSKVKCFLLEAKVRPVNLEKMLHEIFLKVSLMSH